jgi:Na+/proline symporter
MVYRVLEPGLGLDLDQATLTYNGEHAYVNMSKMVLMSGMVGMMLAAMLSATLSNVSGILNVYANVFTYEIWGYKEKNRNADEKTRIKVGRIFTVFFGLLIIVLSMLIPFAGGAEKVVITILTMILCPLYIPSIWGLFSKRLTGNQLIGAMILTWVIGVTAKLTVPASVINPTIIESLSGCVLPVAILTVLEFWSRSKNRVDNGYEVVKGYIDETADVEPDEKMKKATKAYSFMAVSCFLITLGVIALLLLGLIIAGDAKTMAVSGIVWKFIVAIVAMIAAYVVYRYIDSKKN